jgi:LPS-assembly lipoprotein
MRTLAILLLVLLLTACGFQLRGEARLPPAMAETWLNVPDDSTAFVRELSLMLRANGVEVRERPDPAAAELRIFSERIAREALTISGQARVREFVLVFDLDFELRDADGAVLIPRETLRLMRDYSFDEQEILAATREEEFLRKDLRQAMAARLLRRLEAL